MTRYDGKTAIITGGAAGIGLAIARRLATEGARVAITDIAEGAGECAARENGFLFLRQDVTSEEDWPHVVETVETRLGPIDVLVNNAGILGSMRATSPEHTSLADWRQIFMVNVESVFLGCRAIIPALRRNGRGAIVNLSSVAGLLASPYATAYGASKAAVRQLTRSVAQYCAQQRLNVRCNSLHPGDVRTPLWDAQAVELALQRGVPVQTILDETRAVIPLGDFTHVDDIAAAAAFLGCDDARHVTGAELIVDGGIVHCDTFSMGAITAPNSSRHAP